MRRIYNPAIDKMQAKITGVPLEASYLDLLVRAIKQEWKWLHTHNGLAIHCLFMYILLQIVAVFAQIFTKDLLSLYLSGTAFGFMMIFCIIINSAR
jgi:hypothetical protein